MKHALFVSFFLISKLFALEWAIDAHAKLSEPIIRFQVFSERDSGSSYLQSLISKNLVANGKRLPLTNYFGHKHFPRWFELSQSEYLSHEHKYTFDSNASTLFIIIFRDPYDWLRSFNLNPHHAVKKLHKLPFSKFIRTPWRVNPKEQWIAIERRENPYVEIDPITLQPFQNMMKLRSQKIKTMLEIAQKVDNVYLINYETLRDYPEEVLDEIADIFGLKRREEYTPIIYTKGNSAKGTYQPKKYVPISQNDLNWINSQLDHELENAIGYEILSSNGEINNR